MMVLSCLKDCRKLSPIFDYQKYMGKYKKEKEYFLSIDLVSVQPMDGMDSKTRDKIKGEVKATNRERKIESVLEEKPFKEMKIEEHPDYKGGPSAELFYLDFEYGTASSV